MCLVVWLAACGATEPIGYARMAQQTELHSTPQGAGADLSIGILRAGDVVAVLDRWPNGAVKVRTTGGVVGWTVASLIEPYDPVRSSATAGAM